MVVVGQKKDIHDNIAHYINAMFRSSLKTNEKLKKIIDLLKFALDLNDEEIIRATVESIIEILEEEIDK